jgi:transposase
MIRLFTALCKTLLGYLDDEQIVKESTDTYIHHGKACPGCGARGQLAQYGGYFRWLVSRRKRKNVEAHIWIRRFECQSCGATHALLPDILIPYGSYSLRFVLYVLRKYIEREQTVNALCDFFCIAVTTLYKWIHLFNEHTNLLLNAIEQISWVTMPALDFIEKITALPSHFLKQFRFSFLQHMKRQRFIPAPG